MLIKWLKFWIFSKIKNDILVEKLYEYYHKHKIYQKIYIIDYGKCHILLDQKDFEKIHKLVNIIIKKI